MSKEAAKLVEYLYRVQRGIVKSEKYSRLLNSSMNMSALHEAAHAVIGVSLGARVIDAMIEFNVERCDGESPSRAGKHTSRIWVSLPLSPRR